MFGLWKQDPVKSLRRRYEAKMAEAMQLQRAGDIPAYATAHAEAAALYEELQVAEGRAKAPGGGSGAPG